MTTEPDKKESLSKLDEDIRSQLTIQNYLLMKSLNKQLETLHKKTTHRKFFGIICVTVLINSLFFYLLYTGLFSGLSVMGLGILGTLLIISILLFRVIIKLD